MKWKLVLLLVLSLHVSFAQDLWFDEKEDKHDPFVKGGDFIVSLGYGYPNWGAFNISDRVNLSLFSNVKTNGIAPIMLSGYYMYNNQLSFSLIGMFNTWGGSWEQNLFSGENLNYDFNVQRIRLLFGLQYHFFDLDIKKVDIYGGAALGGNSIRVNYSSNDPQWTPRNDNYFIANNDNLDFPLTLRINAGIRYFFDEHWGANMELSYGGASLNFGLSYKF